MDKNINIYDLKGKKFAASYSGGKDSILAIYRSVKAGLIPHKLINTYNTDANRSWFHGITESLLNEVSDSLKIPVYLMRTSGAEYEKNFEKTLTQMKNEEAEICVFGDIDIEEHLEWCTERCNKTGIIPFFPLWQENRKKLVYEFIDSGFSALITIIDTERMSENFIGRILTKDTAIEIEKSGADICGENGEYHTFVFDGPLFSKRIDYITGGTIIKDKYFILPVDIN